MINRQTILITRRATLLMLGLGALVLSMAALATTLRAAAARADGIPPAAQFTGVPQVGALYPTQSAGEHGCTASVIDSRHGNTLITAAHCVRGSGRGMVFAPEQHGTSFPYGRWTVIGAYLEPAWLQRQDPQADVAFLTVAPRRIRGVMTEIESVTGAYKLGLTPARGQRVTVTGYPAGSGNDPITCRAKVDFRQGFPSFDCHGFVSGTSGSPWVRTTRHGREVVGVIGGFHQGGCEEYRSYTSPLSDDAATAYQRATDGDSGDVAPPAGGDGC